MNDEDYKVSSEIYEEHDYRSALKPTFNPQYVVSKFEFNLPQFDPVQVDSDGDLIVPRKHVKTISKCIEIEHSKSTILDLVGLQVWRGALLLADFLIYNQGKFPENSHVLELGSGVGLTSIVAAMFNKVYCTDVNKSDILGLIKHNVNRNKDLIKHSLKITELNFLQPKLPKEIQENLQDISIIIAADTVYDDDITEAFVKTVENLLKNSNRIAYVALEKRYVFTISDCDSVAPCYEFFLECLRNISNLICEEVSLNFPKCFRYDRVKELVLWKIFWRQ